MVFPWGEGRDGAGVVSEQVPSSEGFREADFMIIDTIPNASKYFSVHPLFAKAFEYIKQTDLLAKAPGKYEIDGDNLKAIFSEKNGVPVTESTAKFECHNKHIDIQLCLSGIETIGWKPR